MPMDTIVRSLVGLLGTRRAKTNGWWLLERRFRWARRRKAFVCLHERAMLLEPIPCTMDNWGEGVVPACREERPPRFDHRLFWNTHQRCLSSMFSLEPLPTFLGEQLPSSEANLLSLNDADLTPRPFDSPSSDYVRRSPRSGSGTKVFDRVEQPQHHLPQIEPERSSNYEERSSEKVSSSREAVQPPSVERRPYNHDVLVIETQPPRVSRRTVQERVSRRSLFLFQLEPLSDLFYPTPKRTSDSSSPNPSPATMISKRRRMPAPKAASQLGSEDLVSTTNGTETTMTKGLRKHESKVFDDQRLEEVIARAPVAAHSILKVSSEKPRFSFSSRTHVLSFTNFRVFWVDRLDIETSNWMITEMSLLLLNLIPTSWVREGLVDRWTFHFHAFLSRVLFSIAFESNAMSSNRENRRWTRVRLRRRRPNSSNLLDLRWSLLQWNSVCPRDRFVRRSSWTLSFLPLLSVLPEHSTEVGDLIQPVPGVLYEDSKLKKGDPRRYQVNLGDSLCCFWSYLAGICILIDWHVKIYQFSWWQPAIEAHCSTRWTRCLASGQRIAPEIERWERRERQRTWSSNSQIASVTSNTTDPVRFEHIICIIYSLFSSWNYFFTRNISDRFFSFWTRWSLKGLVLQREPTGEKEEPWQTMMRSIIFLRADTHVDSFSVWFSIFQNPLFHRKDDDDSCLVCMCVSHSKRKWQHSSTLSSRCATTQEMSLLQKSPPPYIRPSRSAHPFSYLSLLYVAISERLPLLMGDVNHRRAQKTRQHVRSRLAGTRASERGRAIKERAVPASTTMLLLLLSISIYRCCDTDKRRFRVMHVHLTLLYSSSSPSSSFSSRSLLHTRYLCSLVSSVDGWWREKSEAKMFIDACSVKPWMMKAVRRVIQSTVLKKEKKRRVERRRERKKKKDGTVMAFFLSCEELAKSTQWINDNDILPPKSSANIRQQLLLLFDLNALDWVEHSRIASRMETRSFTTGACLDGDERKRSMYWSTGSMGSSLGNQIEYIGARGCSTIIDVALESTGRCCSMI